MHPYHCVLVISFHLYRANKQLKIRILITSEIVIAPSSVPKSFCIVSTHSVYKSERHIIPGLGPRRPYIAGEPGREKQFSSLYTTASWPAAAASEDTFDRIHFRPGTRVQFRTAGRAGYWQFKYRSGSAATFSFPFR